VNQIERKPGKSLVAIFGGAIVDGDVLALDKTGLLEAFPQSGEISREALRGGAAEIAEYRRGGVFGWLLRTGDARHGDRRTAEEGDEFPPFHELSTVPRTGRGEVYHISKRGLLPSLRAKQRNLDRRGRSRIASLLGSL
jgi:hypothetical protein